MKNDIHTTIGVYPDLSYVTNGVLSSHLESHIDYNECARPGRALFVDGKCEYEGSLTPEQIKEFEIKCKDIVLDKCTMPYM